MKQLINRLKYFPKGPVNAYKSVKKLLSESFNNGLESQMEIESIHISNNADSKDGIEGLTAFSEKENPTLMKKNLLMFFQKKIAYVDEGKGQPILFIHGNQLPPIYGEILLKY